MAFFVSNPASYNTALAPQQAQLFTYAQLGDFESCERLLRSGVLVNFVEPVTTDSPLMIACRRGHHDIVRLCLDYGAKNDPHPEFGHTALHAAVLSSQVRCAEIILKVA